MKTLVVNRLKYQISTQITNEKRKKKKKKSKLTSMYVHNLLSLQSVQEGFDPGRWRIVHDTH